MPRSKPKTMCLWNQLFLLGIAFLGLSACATTTIRPVTDSYANMAAQDLVDTNSADSSNMEKLPYEQLIQKGQMYLDNGTAQLAKLHFGMALRKKPDSVAALPAWESPSIAKVKSIRR